SSAVNTKVQDSQNTTMVLVVEKTGTGKPCLVVGNYKYRESHTLTNGDVAWRCLGRLCTATVRTDSERSTILLHKDNHSGKHPQTFRNVTPLTSPLQNNDSVDYGSSFSSLALSPLVSQVVKKVKTEERSIQTDDECLKSKDELLNRITELTSHQSALIDKIQNLQLELEANEHGRISSSSIKVDVAIGCDIPHQHDADPQTELSFNVPSFECKQCEKEKQRVKYYEDSNFHFQIELFFEHYTTMNTADGVCEVTMCSQPKKLYVFGDSHARNISGILQRKVSHSVFVCASSNASSDYILKNANSMAESLTKNDTAVLIVGTNDV
ncbi:hypothetical protein J6590_104563, partial [Homalodisca vitripennis]